MKATTIPIQENSEELIDQKTIEQLGLICEPFWDDSNDLEGQCYHTYISQHPNFNLSLRRSVVERLLQAQSMLPDEWRLNLKAGFRPFSVQLALLEELIKDVRQRNPLLSERDALEHARAYVADPRIGCPPHTTGGAVDINVVNSSNHEPIKMGCPPNTDDARAALHSTAISADEYKNRLLLLNAMLTAGFAPHHNEWWHYSYGDTRWAAFYKRGESLYGIIND